MTIILILGVTMGTQQRAVGLRAANWVHGDEVGHSVTDWTADSRDLPWVETLDHAAGRHAGGRAVHTLTHGAVILVPPLTGHLDTLAGQAQASLLGVAVLLHDAVGPPALTPARLAMADAPGFAVCVCVQFVGAAVGYNANNTLIDITA